MNSRTKKAEYLLDEIGHIDDSLLVEALSVRRKRRTYIPAIIAATLAVCLVLMLSGAVVLGVAVSVFNKLEDGAQGGDDVSNNTQPAPEKHGSLDSLMSSYRGGAFTTLTEGEIPYRDGNAYIVWQYTGEEKYYMSKPLEMSEVNLLSRDFGEGKQVSENDAQPDCRVWILLSDGSVRSPYLKNTDGNIGASVFDYNAEIYPTQYFVDNVSAIID